MEVGAAMNVKIDYNPLVLIPDFPTLDSPQP